MANFAYISMNRLCEMRTKGREGVKNSKNFAKVLNGCPLSNKITTCDLTYDMMS